MLFIRVIILIMTVKAQIVAINKLLSDIYQKPMRLSYLLSDTNFDSETIKLIAERLLTEAINSFIETLQETMLDCRDGQRLFDILNSVYGLDGQTPKTLQRIGDELKISRERVRQLKQKATEKLKANNNRMKMQDRFKEKIIILLKQNISSDDCLLVNKRSISDLEFQTKHTFKIHQSIERINYITISVNQNCQVTSSIVITEDNIQRFCDELMQTINLLGWKHDLKLQKKYSIDDIKAKYQRAYEKWTVEEEEILVSKFEHGISIKEIAIILERQPSAINSRLQKLGLK
jgi:hypothetical protein